MIRAIAAPGCDIYKELITITKKIEPDIKTGKELYWYVEQMKSPPNIRDVYGVIEHFKCNSIIYNDRRLDYYFDPTDNYHLSKPLLVFHYKRAKDIDFIGKYAKVSDFTSYFQYFNN